MTARIRMDLESNWISIRRVGVVLQPVHLGGKAETSGYSVLGRAHMGVTHADHLSQYFGTMADRDNHSAKREAV